MKPLTFKEKLIVQLFLYDQTATNTVVMLGAGIAMYIVPLLVVATKIEGIIYLGIPLFSGLAVAGSVIMLPIVLLRRYAVGKSHKWANKLLVYKNSLR